MFVVGIIAGLAAVSAEGCDGPVLVQGVTFGSCHCQNTTPGDPHQPPTGNCAHDLVYFYWNDYYICGGSGYTYCAADTSATVGYIIRIASLHLIGGNCGTRSPRMMTV